MATKPVARTLYEKVARLEEQSAHQREMIEQLEQRAERLGNALQDLYQQVYGEKHAEAAARAAVDAIPEPMGRSAY